MRLDIRLPLGLLFTVFGLLLVIFGAASSRQLYEKSLGVNVNLWWGVVLLVFGIVSLLLGRHGQSRQADSSGKQATGKSAIGHE